MSLHDAAEIRMINKIVVHFGYLPTEQAVAEVANHVHRFWDPRMKRRLFELVDSQTTGSNLWRWQRRRCCGNRLSHYG
jgi:formate dehydrogenase subunit delta